MSPFLRKMLTKCRILPAKEGGCWLWSGDKCAGGYGRVYLGGGRANPKEVRAHRVSYSEFYGVPLSEIILDVLHCCDTPNCINPSHLFLGDDLDNARDRAMKGRTRAPSCEDHCFATLTNDQVVSIFTDPRPGSVMMKLFGVSKSVVSRIRTQKTWKKITNGLSQPIRIRGVA